MPNINTKLGTLKGPENEARNLVRDRVELSLRRFGGQNAKFREFNRYYYSLSPALQGRDNDRPTDSKTSREPDLFVPLFFTLVEQAVPQWLFQVFSSRPYLRVLGRTPDDHQRASSIQRLLDYDFDRMQLFMRTIPIAKNMFKYGTGIFKVGWKYDAYDTTEVWERREPSGLDALGRIIFGSKTRRERRKKRVVRYDGPWVTNVSPFNAMPDPLYPEISEMRYFAERRFTDLRTLEHESKMHEWLTGKPLYKNLDKIPTMKATYLQETYQGNFGDDVGEAMGWAGGPNQGMNQYTATRGNAAKDTRYEDVIEVIEYWARDHEKTGDRMIFLANGETPILDDEIQFEDKEIPYGAVRCFPIEDQFWGQGLLHPTERLQEEVNSHRNLWMRNLQLSVNQVWIVDESVDVPPNASYFDPGDIVQGPFYANGKPPAMPLYPQQRIDPEVFMLEDRMIGDAQRAVGSSSLIEPTADTATEAELQRAGGAVRDRLHGAIGEQDFLVKVGKLALSRRQQFFDEVEVIRILGADGVEFKRMSYEDVAGEYDFMPTTSSLSVQPNVIRQQLEQVIAIRSQDPEMQQILKGYELALELMKSFEVKDPERFVRKPPERVVDAHRENLVMLAGEWIEVEMHDPHEEHIQLHEQALQRAISEGADQAIEQLMKHIRIHRKIVEQTNSTPMQEEPGSIQGPQAESIPGMDNAIPTEGSLNAGTRG